jgi:peroxiredoxin
MPAAVTSQTVLESIVDRRIATMTSHHAPDGRRLLPLAMVRKWLCVALFSGAVTAALGHATNGQTEPGVGAGTLVPVADLVAPLFALPNLDGATHDLTGNRDRVVLVHFFATWCEPCRPEMERLRGLQFRLAGRPFAIVPVSVAEAAGAVRRFFAGEPLPFPVLLDRDRAVAKSWRIHTLPSTVVLDRELKARFIAEGDVDWSRPDVMNILWDLLGEAPG